MNKLLVQRPAHIINAEPLASCRESLTWWPTYNSKYLTGIKFCRIEQKSHVGSASINARISPCRPTCPFAAIVSQHHLSKSCDSATFRPAFSSPKSSPIAPENNEITGNTGAPEICLTFCILFAFSGLGLLNTLIRVFSSFVTHFKKRRLVISHTNDTPELFQPYIPNYGLKENVARVLSLPLTKMRVVKNRSAYTRL